jgi:uncharacterized protein
MRRGGETPKVDGDDERAKSVEAIHDSFILRKTGFTPWSFLSGPSGARFTGAMNRFSKIAFTSTVKAVQSSHGSRGIYERMERDSEQPDALGDWEAQFLAQRDSFTMATVGENGWPYVQHRGGPKGFVHVLDPHTIAFADFRGNRQYISVGNLKTDDRVALIFMDYPNRARLKVLAHASISEEPSVLAQVENPDYKARVERAIVFRVEGFDWNCPQHITPRFTEDEILAMTRPLRERLAALERENASLRARV